MHPTQTSTQLGVSNGRIMLRGLLVRCPACGARHPHASFSKLKQRCENCALTFYRVEGHDLGYIGINTIVTFTVTFLVLVCMSLAMRPNINVKVLFMVLPIPALLLPILMVPVSQTLWTAIDLVMRHLRPGEIDPRFVKVDPELGEWDLSPFEQSADSDGQ
jgi:uncharacterized protein (DUF983 family)